MSKERELLVKAWNLLIYLMGGKIGDGISSINRKFLYELKECISQPEQPEQTEQEDIRDVWQDGYEAGLRLAKREPLSDGITADMYRANNKATHPDSYWAGVYDAEKAQGIGE